LLNILNANRNFGVNLITSWRFFQNLLEILRQISVMLLIKRDSTFLFLIDLFSQISPYGLYFMGKLNFKNATSLDFRFHGIVWVLKVFIPSLQSFYFLKVFQTLLSFSVVLLIPFVNLKHLLLYRGSKIHKANICFTSILVEIWISFTASL
jgi:hypothetical protein